MTTYNAAGYPIFEHQIPLCKKAKKIIRKNREIKRSPNFSRFDALLEMVLFPERYYIQGETLLGIFYRQMLEN